LKSLAAFKGGLGMSIKKGDEVLLHYDMMLENGKVIESTRRGVPFCLHVGSNVMPQGFEKSLIGMKKGDKKKFALPPGKLFGERKENLTAELPKSSFVDDHELSKGKIVEVFGKKGEMYMASILEVKKDTVIVDPNHPLAGRSLLFNVEIVDVFPAKKNKSQSKKKYKTSKKTKVKRKKRTS
jgi:FKBP-type peptidyl-prolyl cis-trans isomerase SlpA